MDKRTLRAFRPGNPSPLEERLAPGNFLGDLGNTFTSLGKRIADPYVQLGNRIAGVDTTPARNPRFTSTQIRRWTVIARVVSGEISAPPPTMLPFAPTAPAADDARRVLRTRPGGLSRRDEPSNA